MERIRLHVSAGVIATSLALATAACGGDSDTEPTEPPPGPAPPELILERAPEVIREACREIAADASRTVYCPARVPPPKHPSGRYISVKEMRSVSGESVVGLQLSYVADKQPALQNTYVHLYLMPTDVLPYLPRKSREAEFAGREGTLYPATGHAPQNNHFNFSCKLDYSDEEHWISVHNVGRGSRQLLDAMVSELEPVEPPA